MAKGSKYGPERAILKDPRSGLRVIRLTHHATISMNLYFEMCAFSADDQYVFFVSQRDAGRDAPWDLFRARTDGLELIQVTECDHIGGIVVSPATDCVFYQCDGEIRKVDIASLKEKTVARTPIAPSGGQTLLASIDAKGKTYFGSCSSEKGIGILFKMDTVSGEISVLFEGEQQGHIHVDARGRTLEFGEFHQGAGTPYLIDADGRRLRPFPFTQFAHCTWLAKSNKMQATLLPPGNAIVTQAEGDERPTVLTGGRYYWHSGASLDGQWIIADTNWPQEGLYLLHVPTRTVTFVCDPRASCSHPQWTHPHPSISPNKKFILFNSDMTGLGQVYLVELTDDFLKQASQGYLCGPNFTA